MSATPPTTGGGIPTSSFTSSSGRRPRASPTMRARRGLAAEGGCSPRRRAAPVTSAPTSPTMFGSSGASMGFATSPLCISSTATSGPPRCCWTASWELFAPQASSPPSGPVAHGRLASRVHPGPSELVLDASGPYVTSRGTDHAPGSRVTQIEAGSLATSPLEGVPEQGGSSPLGRVRCGRRDRPVVLTPTPSRPLGWSGSIQGAGG